MEEYTQSSKNIQELYTVDTKGLTKTQVQTQKNQFGPNELPRSNNTRTRLRIFLSQFTDVLVLILLAAGIVSGLLGEMLDMAVILITVAINAVVGFVQEDKANKALEKLGSLIQYDAVVTRDGVKQTIPSSELVPGDMLHLEAGDKVQADGRVILLTDFYTDESALTGEYEPIEKHTDAIAGPVPIGDRKNMVYKGTVITNGHATVIVTATGALAEIGKIADLVHDTKDERTPLQVQLSRLSKIIGAVVILICISIFAAELLFSTHGESTIELFSVAVAIAIAAIPEGLVISLTIILAIGMGEILKKNALVRKLVAAETLGSVSVICTDKTGTITEGRMSVSEIHTISRAYTKDELALVTSESRSQYAAVSEILRLGTIANDGLIQEKEDGLMYTGDSTDTAFLRAGFEVGYDARSLAEVTPRLSDIPFSSEYMYMAALTRSGSDYEVAIKGAPDVLLPRSSHIMVGDKRLKCTAPRIKQMQELQHRLSEQGLRLIAVASKSLPNAELEESDVAELTFHGIVAITDPIRSDVRETLRITTAAGIRTIMITGDHMETAESIGRSIGLVASPDQIFDGARLNHISASELREVVQTAVIFARVDPVHKIHIVEALQANGEVVAMTGDGVNDAPAIKGSDIGVALGSGTDVAKETADMVLLDNAYSTIVKAVEQGRRVYQNIQKVVLYLISGSFSEIILITGSLFAGLPLPILPAQILWMNIVEDVFPNLALAFDKGDPENMTEKPRKKAAKVVDKRMFWLILIRSIFANIALFIIFLYVLRTTSDIALTRSVMFIGLGLDSLFYIFAVRSMRRMVWQINVFDNKFFLPAIAFAFAMVLIPLYFGPLQALLRLQPITLEHWIIMAGFGIFNLLTVEILKAVYIYRDKKAALLR